MLWKRPIWFWIFAYFWCGATGAGGLFLYVRWLMLTQDSDPGGPLGYFLGLLIAACVGFAGGIALCALIQFVLWLCERYRKNYDE